MNQVKMSPAMIRDALMPGAKICDEIARGLPSGYCLNVTFNPAMDVNLNPKYGDGGFSNSSKVMFEPGSVLSPDGLYEGRVLDGFFYGWAD